MGESRGSYKIFLGMAAGVGKTYRMLQEARAAAEAGRDVLAAGIDVFSTVNVQHLESLNDQVAELTGVRVRETFPDTVLSSADEVVLIDLTPQALIQRLRDGKVYPHERVEAALNNFFKL